MNWYKQSQAENNWKRILTTFGLTAVVGLSILWGIGLLDLKKLFFQEPQKIEQALVQIQKQQTEQIPDQISQSSEDIYNMIERYEGKRNKVYFVNNIPHIGIGFNLEKANAGERLSQIGINIADILNSRQALTDGQIYKLFKEDVAEAINNAKSFLPDFNQQPQAVQNVLIDMAFNMGYNRLSGFVKLKEALLNKDYKRASNEMIDSKWYNQVGNRSKELVLLMRNI